MLQTLDRHLSKVGLQQVLAGADVAGIAVLIKAHIIAALIHVASSPRLQVPDQDARKAHLAHVPAPQRLPSQLPGGSSRGRLLRGELRRRGRWRARQRRYRLTLLIGLLPARRARLRLHRH